MKNLSRILTIVLCFAPFAYANAAGPVATTAGSNLTAFNPSTANNNQWATLSNGRYDTNTSAKVDFGNCNSVILRCAQPKCSNGGCADISVASAIVKGCVQSNKSCSQYGDDLVTYMSAQLVAASNAKVNEQNAAAQQAAAAAAQQQSQQQMAAMQQQMQQMQQQMARQQAESQQQLQAALAQQAAQSQAAIENMKSAATAAAKQNEAGVSAYQQDAINRGISADVLERQKITGQVMTELENAEVSLKELKTAMNSAFEYAGCDSRGNNCVGPKRVKKWRELATGFLDPYDNTIDKLYDGLELAQLAGVNLSDIYMMLNNSCNRWGQYMCERGSIEYLGTNNTPYSCKRDLSTDERTQCENRGYDANPDTRSNEYKKAYSDCRMQKQDCKPCTLLKVLSTGDEVYEGWIDADYGNTTSNTTVVACASGALDSSALFARRTKNKNGAGLVDIDKLDVWLNQNEPRKTKRLEPADMYKYCDIDVFEEKLQKAISSKSISATTLPPLCVTEIGTQTADRSDDCGYINQVYAICDTHLYNVGKGNASESVSADPNDCNDTEREAWDTNALWAQKVKGQCAVSKFCKNGYKANSASKKCESATNWEEYKTTSEYTNALNDYNRHISAQFGEMKEVIALKTTVISQQMYKQYEYLSATLRRLKTQLEKAVLTASLQAAGAKSEESSSGLLGGGSKSSQYRDCTGKTKQGTLECLRENYSLLASQINNKKCDKNAQEQLKKDIKIMVTLKALTKECSEPSKDKCSNCLIDYNSGLMNLDSLILNEEAMRQGKYYYKE